MSDDLSWLDNLPTDAALKVQDVANALRLSKATIYKMLSSGDFPGFKVGKSWRISPVALRKYMQNKVKVGD